MSSDVVKVRMRIMNNIHVVKMSPSGVTDVLLNGLQSTIVKTLKNGRPESIVTGHYENPVEILSAINQSEMPSNTATEEVMEFEVSIFMYYLMEQQRKL